MNDNKITRRNVFINSAVLGAAGSGMIASSFTTPAFAAKKKTTVLASRTTTVSNYPTGLGFTIASPLQQSYKQSVKDIDKIYALGGQWVRFGYSAQDLIGGWGNPVWLKEKPLSLLVKTLKYIKSKNMKVCFLTVEGYLGDVSHDEYLFYMSQYWRLLAKSVAQYVDVWQVYNEPDGWHYRDYSNVSDLSNIEQVAYYKELAGSIKACRAIVKSYNSKIRITTNLSGWPINDDMEANWIRELDIIHESLDVITIDAYPEGNETEIRELPNRLSRLKNRYGKNVMIGEIGMQTCTTCYPLQYAADSIKLWVNYIPHKDVEAMIFYTLRDTTNDNDGEDSFGIMTFDGSPKQYVYDTMTQALQNYYQKYSIASPVVKKKRS